MKYRKNDVKGSPLDAVSYYKKKSMIKAAKYYLHKNYYGKDVNVRFDVISIKGEEITLVKDAFWIE